MSRPVLVYGAYGYTGRLVARLARERGIPLIVAGRDAAKTNEVARETGHDARCFGLDDATALAEGVKDAGAVLHCAGPFSQTAAAMVDACLAVGVPYLDITGEIAVFEALAARDAEARARGIGLLPGAGYDVVPSDCLAAHLHRRLPSATHLVLALGGLGAGASHGTAATSIEGAALGGRVRVDGRIVEVPLGGATREVPFPSGPFPTVRLPWGDVSTAFHSTGIPNVEVRVAVPRGAALFMPMASWFAPLLRARFVQAGLRRMVDANVTGPADAARLRGRAELWGEARDEAGRCVSATLVTREGYTLTAEAALDASLRAARGELPVGFQTPSKAFGADYVLGFDGTERRDVA